MQYVLSSYALLPHPYVSQAAKFIEQGHVRVGPNAITDPAFLVTRHVFFAPSRTPPHPFRRHMEDFVTWVDTSKLKRTVMAYNDEVCPSATFPVSSLTTYSSTISICCEPSLLSACRARFASPLPMPSLLVCYRLSPMADFA